MLRAQTTRRAAASLALLVSLALVGAELSGLGHALTTRHLVCPEHGELLDLERGHESAAEPTGSAAPGLRSGERLGASHAHEHCALALFLRASALSVPEIGDAALLEGPGGLVLSPRHQQPSRAIPLLHLAPKCSPPASV